MIFVFVIDTSPSMGKPVMMTNTVTPSSSSVTTANSTDSASNTSSSSLTRLDLAKMVVEDFHRQWRKLRLRQQQQQQQQATTSLMSSLGQLPTTTTTSTNTNTTSTTSSVSSPSVVQLPDQFLLISTSRQQHVSSSVSASSSSSTTATATATTTTATCAGGGRLLVGYHHHHLHNNTNTVPTNNNNNNTSTNSGIGGGRSTTTTKVTTGITTTTPNLVVDHHNAATIAMEAFHHELKQLKVATIPSNYNNHTTTNNHNDNDDSSTATTTNTTWQDEWGGAAGLNIALSTGLELLSRYRLQHKHTEHFGMGRLPNTAISMILSSSSNSNTNVNSSSTMSQQQQQQQQWNTNTNVVMVGPATTALQPACLIVLTDGACLRNSEKQGGGSLQLHYGSQPLLREFYVEPFRWDQRIFILAIGVNNNTTTSTQYLHPQLRTLCEVTGGAHFLVRWKQNNNNNNNSGGSCSGIQSANEALLKRICPIMPKELPLPDPLYSNNKRLFVGNSNNSGSVQPGLNPYTPIVLNNTSIDGNSNGNNKQNESYFSNGGPICSFECLEQDSITLSSAKKAVVQQRAMLLYVGSSATTITTTTNANDAANLGNTSNSTTTILSPPLYCIPESYFPNKMMSTLPPRSAQPKLLYSKYPTNLGMKSFVPIQLIQQLYRLDQLHISIHNYKQQQQRSAANVTTSTTGTYNNPTTTTPARLLHRDVYICEWIDAEGGSKASSSSSLFRKPSLFNPNNTTTASQGQKPIEYFPVFVSGAGRPSLSEDGENYLNIGILHHPIYNNDKNSNNSNEQLYTTLTLLPPDPHILIPLLLRAAEMEYRAWKKAIENVNNNINSNNGTLKSSKIAAKAGSSSLSTATSPMIKINITLDEQWKSEFRAYLFRIPPYYHNSVKRSLRPILPTNVHAVLLPTESVEYIASQCFSKVCHQKIRNGELISKDQNERIERQEAMIRYCSTKVGGATSSTILDENSSYNNVTNSNNDNNINSQNQYNYGRYDPRFSLDTYLTSLRHLPAPWRVPGLSVNSSMKRNNKRKVDVISVKTDDIRMATSKRPLRPGPLPSAADVLGDLPAKGLLAFYESRRRWIFGGPGLAIRGLHIEGVPNDGSNSQQCGRNPFNTENKNDDDYECLLTFGGVGASILNQTTTTKMGDYRERLLFAQSPIVGYGSNDAAGVSATTAINGAPIWSVDDDALPVTFFDPKSGEFSDSAHARASSKLMVNFGNPFKEKRGNSLIPEKFLSQAPSSAKVGIQGSLVSERPISPPHESFDSVEEGEATFVLNSPTRTSPKREEVDAIEPPPPPPPLPPPPPPTKIPNKRPRSDSIESVDSMSASERRGTPPPPPRPPAPKTSLSMKSPVPPPPPPLPIRRTKSNTPLPQPPLSTPEVLPVTPTINERRQPSVPSSSRQPPKPPPPPSKPSVPKETTETLSVPISSQMEKDVNIASSDLHVNSIGQISNPANHGTSSNMIVGGNEERAQHEQYQFEEEFQTQQHPAPPTSQQLQDDPKPKPLQEVLTLQRQQDEQKQADNELENLLPSSSQQQQDVTSTALLQPLILDNEHVKPNVVLPNNWICVWSKSKQRWYFFDTKTNKSVWEWPPL